MEKWAVKIIKRMFRKTDIPSNKVIKDKSKYNRKAKHKNRE